MKIREFPFMRVFALVVLGAAGVQVARAVASGPNTVPQEKDVKAAAREAKPLTGGVDERRPLPEGELVGGNGLVEPADREVKVAAPVAGLITAIKVNEGERVEAGAVLVELENSSEKAALAAAEAEVAVAQAELVRARRGLRREDVDAAVADADAARARAELSAGVLVRTQALAKSGASTPDELERSAKQAANDQAGFKAADARRRAALGGSRAEDIQVAIARAAAAEARREEARARFDRRTVRAPQRGEILEVKSRAGEFYNPNGAEPLLVMGDTTVLRVRMDVDERDIARLALQAKAYVEADAFPGQRFAGTVVEVGRRMGRKNIRTDEPTERIDTKILEVLIRLDAPGPLVPGLRVKSYVEARKVTG